MPEQAKIFISHASEDKADFVHPLAQALSRKFTVWYDEYELTLGDSLLKKINEGLHACDYGVVVLSQAFFGKKWPQSELDGLFALETSNRKIILPIWKDISEADVKRFSPILAGRLAAVASDGVERVVSQIERAVQASDRTREVTGDNSLLKSAMALDASLQEQANVTRLSHCEEGAAMVRKSFSTLADLLTSKIESVHQTSKLLKFTLSQDREHEAIQIVGNHGLVLHLTMQGLGGNYTYETVLRATIYKRNFQVFRQEVAPTVIRELAFTPSFDLASRVLWIGVDRKSKHMEDQLADHPLEALINEIRRRST